MAKRASKAGDNKPEASAADLNDCLAEYTEMMSQQARLGQKIATMFGRYEKVGVKPKIVKQLYKYQNSDTAQQDHEELTRALIATSLIEYDGDGQASFLAVIERAPKAASDDQAKLRAARAYNDGYNSGKHGGAIDACRLPPGSEEYVRWRDGWQDGQADRLARNPQAANVKQATPRGRGRKGGKKGAPAPASESDLDDVEPAGTA